MRAAVQKSDLFQFLHELEPSIALGMNFSEQEKPMETSVGGIEGCSRGGWPALRGQVLFITPNQLISSQPALGKCFSFRCQDIWI